MRTLLVAGGCGFIGSMFPEKLIPTMISCALANKPLPVYGDGGNIRDWIHVEDHCSGIKKAWRKPCGGTWTISRGVRRSRGR